MTVEEGYFKMRFQCFTFAFLTLSIGSMCKLSGASKLLISLRKKMVKRCSGNFIWMHFFFHLILNIHSPYLLVLGIHILLLKTIKRCKECFFSKVLKPSSSKDQYWPLGWLVLPSGWVGWHQQSGLHPWPPESPLVWLLWLLGQLTQPEFTIWASA